MRRTSSTLPKAMALVVMVMAGVAVMNSTDSTRTTMAEPTLVGSTEFAPCDDPGAVAPQSSVLTAEILDHGAIAPEPVAICRLFPECWVNSDCDARCGAGLGKCVHSNCPPRVCRCR